MSKAELRSKSMRMLIRPESAQIKRLLLTLRKGVCKPVPEIILNKMEKPSYLTTLSIEYLEVIFSVFPLVLEGLWYKVN